jgi:hypothetical protein
LFTPVRVATPLSEAATRSGGLYFFGASQASVTTLSMMCR